MTSSLSPNLVSTDVPQGLYTQQGMPSQPLSIHPQPRQLPRPAMKVETNCLQTKPYSDFKFNHMFSMRMVGPSQGGKTFFVEQLPTVPCVKYPSEKPRRIFWFYNQWKIRYMSLKSKLGDEIVFTKGLPDMSEHLSEVNPKLNNVFVFDDLMSQATESPVLSLLFTQGRHRNASRILLLKNMFRKGNSTQILEEMPSTWCCFAVRETENRLVLWLSGFLIKIVQHLCLLTRKKPRSLMGMC